MCNELSDRTSSSDCVISSLDLRFNIMPFVESSHNFRFELAGSLEYLTQLITRECCLAQRAHCTNRLAIGM
jgi:hypothetical protein